MTSLKPVSPNAGRRGVMAGIGLIVGLAALGMIASCGVGIHASPHAAKFNAALDRCQRISNSSRRNSCQARVMHRFSRWSEWSAEGTGGGGDGAAGGRNGAVTQ